MKENDTVLPKRSHTIYWFTVKSAKGMLRPSGLTSVLQYCCSQRDVCVVIIGCYDRIKRSSLLLLSGRIWLIEYPAWSVVLLHWVEPLNVPLTWLNHCGFTENYNYKSRDYNKKYWVFKIDCKKTSNFLKQAAKFGIIPFNWDISDIQIILSALRKHLFVDLFPWAVMMTPSF